MKGVDFYYINLKWLLENNIIKYILSSLLNYFN